MNAGPVRQLGAPSPADARAVDAVNSVYATFEPHASRAARVPGLRAEIEALLDQDVDALLKRTFTNSLTRTLMQGALSNRRSS